MKQTSPPKSNGLPKGTTTILAILTLGRSLAWTIENQQFNTFLYNDVSPDPKAVSAMVAITAIVSMVTAIMMGTLSDRTVSKWGKRKPYLVLGFILWGFSIAAFPLAAFFRSASVGVFMAILFDSIMSFFGATATDAALPAYVADVTTESNRGRVLGTMKIMSWLAMLLIYGASGFIIEAYGYLVFFLIIALVVLLIGLFVTPHIKEPPSTEKPTRSYWREIADTFSWKSLVKNQSLFLVLISITMFMIAFNVFFPFLLIYLEHELQFSIMVSSLMVAVTILVAGVIIAYPVGLLVDKIGRRPIAIASVLALSAGLIAFSFFRSIVPVVLSCIIWLAGYTSWEIATQAWAQDLYPEDKRGQFSGIYILFNVALTMVPGPLIGGWLADKYGTPAIINGMPGIIPPALLFQVAAALVLLTFIPLLLAKPKDEKKQSEEPVD
jgi:MFS family permease